MIYYNRWVGFVSIFLIWRRGNWPKMMGAPKIKKNPKRKTKFFFSCCWLELLVFPSSLIIIAAALKLIYNGEPIELESIPAIIIIIIILHLITN
jgi:hypothetical protein